MDDMKIVIEKTITCKNCGSDAIVKFGTYKGVQRFYCKACKRKFKADDDAFHMKVPAEYVSSALSMYYSGMSINGIRSHLKQEHGYYPSKSIVFGWVNKYTELASKQFKDYHPAVGDIWVADETMLDVDGEHKLWFYDIIDTKTRYLLASRVALTRTTNDAEMLMKEASERAGKNPKEVITDSNNSYLDGIEKTFGSDTEHVQGNPFRVKGSGESTSQIERFHGTLKDRTKVIRAFRDFETLKQFTDGWLIYYNYFKPHISLDGKTPAEQAHVQYDVKNWADLARVPVTKNAEVSTHKTPNIRLITKKVKLDKAFKRKRPYESRKPKTRKTDLGGGIVQDRRGRHIRL
jgi:putative transposase